MCNAYTLIQICYNHDLGISSYDKSSSSKNGLIFPLKLLVFNILSKPKSKVMYPLTKFKLVCNLVITKLQLFKLQLGYNYITT
jgi:hypothetical protein